MVLEVCTASFLVEMTFLLQYNGSRNFKIFYRMYENCRQICC